jgi:uncharacterized protein YeaO (DUF488 family)
MPTLFLENTKFRHRNYDYWFKILSPPDDLVRIYHERDLPFRLFKDLYMDYLGKYDVREAIEKLADMALIHDITLLCDKEALENCYRKIVAEKCMEYRPELDVEHK